MATDDSSYSGGSDTSSQPLSRERVKLLSSNNGNSSFGLPDRDPSFKCFCLGLEEGHGMPLSNGEKDG
ncbi:hypothetical protein ACFX2I_025874 [Malus domestica]